MTIRPPGRVTRTISLATCAKDADNEIEAVILEFVQVRGVAFLKPAIGEAQLLDAPVAGGNQVACDIDAQHVGATLGLGNRGRAVAASEVEHLEPLFDPESAHESFAALPHVRCKSRKVAFFPKCLVRVRGHRNLLAILTVESARCGKGSAEWHACDLQLARSDLWRGHSP